jgi:nicotinate-nucleotide adenylyltransferase
LPGPSRSHLGRRDRIGIFGGAFNPIHQAHLRSAEEVCETLRLDRVLFVPTGNPPHKPTLGLAPARHRLAMVRRAIAGNPRFAASTVEIGRPGGSYSIDTVARLKRRYPAARLHLIIGMDQYHELRTWKAYHQLLQTCDLVVTSRPGYSLERSRRALPVAVRREFCYGSRPDRLIHSTGTEIIFVRITDLQISASAIRDRIRSGSSVRYLVPSSVHRYLLQHRLYREG